MKAAYINELGPPENIMFAGMPEPVIDASQALVKVVAVAVDPIDTYIRRLVPLRSSNEAALRPY